MSTEISKVMREIPMWGTIVFIECDGPDKDLLETGIDKCAEFEVGETVFIARKFRETSSIGWSSSFTKYIICIFS